VTRILLALALGLSAAGASGQESLQVGSKRFTESYILGEILTQTARAAGVPADHRPGMGGTAILFEALRTGAIDIYPEYTGTIAREILKTKRPLSLAKINARLLPLGIEAGVVLGFNNTYAIGMRRPQAARLGIQKISDLRNHPGLRFGFGHEFLGRADGWPGLKAAYGLPQRTPRGLDHGLAYEAVAAGEIDAMDVYTTDAKIARYDIVTLTDDRRFFPDYDAVLLYRLDARKRFPGAFEAFDRLKGAIDAKRMAQLNARAELDKRSFGAVAAEFIAGSRTTGHRSLVSTVFAPDFWRLLREHVGLVFFSLVAAALVGVPLGIAAAKLRAMAQPVLALAGLVQTVPALALLAFLIPITGTIGLWPALIALFLYALLPIVRNTHAGLKEVSGGLRQAALALGLRPQTVLARIELPLAAPTIMAGVKTSAVINVGTATIAAFIGAGGFGERIAQGLALNDNIMLLAGALPAAALALVVHVLFELAERALLRRRP